MRLEARAADQVDDFADEYQAGFGMRVLYSVITVAFLGYSTLSTAALRLQACVEIGAEPSTQSSFDGEELLAGAHLGT